MKFWICSLVFGVLCTIGVGQALARTWYVELDGSGDFADIQPAVDASAAGDTIRIGPGRFDTFHPCVAPGWTEDAIVSVTQNNLTFLGSGKGITVLGPSEYYGTPSTSPKVFCSIDSYDGIIRDMTMENVEQGIYWFEGRLVVEGCVFRAFHQSFIGISPLWANGSVVNCEFEFSNGGSACIIGGTPQDFTVQNCVFKGWGFGVRVGNSSQNITISGSVFEYSYLGIQFDWQSTGSVNNCDLRNIAYMGVSISDFSNVTLDRVNIDGSDIGVSVLAGAVMSGTNVVIENTVSAGVQVHLQGNATLHNSHILPGSGRAVSCTEYPGDYRVLDMTGNYWGTTDRDSIAAMINDSNDDPLVHCTVEFEPFADGPVPTKKESLGGFRSMFR